MRWLATEHGRSLNGEMVRAASEYVARQQRVEEQYS
jgi:hypothetical protein